MPPSWNFATLLDRLDHWLAGVFAGETPTPPPWRFTTPLDLFDHWQTLIAGLLAIGAAWWTVRATVKSADREIKASQDQTAVAQKQIETTIYFERMRDCDEGVAFFNVLEAAMERVLAEAAFLRTSRIPHLPLSAQSSSAQALNIRKGITKGAFAELRTACLRRGGLAGEFLDLEREIDSFAAQGAAHDGLKEQLDLIEAKATGLRDKAARMGMHLVDSALQLNPPEAPLPPRAR
jgi:hypothetical protein